MIDENTEEMINRKKQYVKSIDQNISQIEKNILRVKSLPDVSNDNITDLEQQQSRLKSKRNEVSEDSSFLDIKMVKQLSDVLYKKSHTASSDKGKSEKFSLGRRGVLSLKNDDGSIKDFVLDPTDAPKSRQIVGQTTDSNEIDSNIGKNTKLDNLSKSLNQYKESIPPQYYESAIRAIELAKTGTEEDFNTAKLAVDTALDNIEDDLNESKNHFALFSQKLKNLFNS